MTETIKLSTLDTHFADFIVRIDKHPGDALWWGAALASNAATRGHSCFNLYELPPFPQRIPPPPADTARWFEALQQCDTVGAPGAFTPLVLEPAGRLYLQRCWKYEQTVATQILSRCQAPLSHDADLETALDRYFPIQEGVIDLQRSAARMALTHRFSVISGGPGTGKTATVARILALLCESIPESPPTILLAAPTGKAALRLHQSIMQAAGRLALADDIRKRLPTEVQTIHRLLGVQPRSGGFRHNHDNRLTCDVLVVDEASMVDLQLMASLLEALRDDARVILLGDRNRGGSGTGEYL
jgi:exodeoxyribonuclease V alpha subunit